MRDLRHDLFFDEVPHLLAEELVLLIEDVAAHRGSFWPWRS